MSSIFLLVSCIFLFRFLEYQVDSIDGWNLTHKETYVKVLQRCGFLGWKRLALLPYGGLVYVSWGKGEIQVLKYQPRPNGSPADAIECHQLYSLQWNSEQDDIEVQCLQCNEGRRPAVLKQSCRNMDGPLFPVICCASEDCHNTHSSPLRDHGRSNKKFKKEFQDHPDAFQDSFHKGSNCPMLPFPPWAEGDQAKSPVKLGLYTGDYGSHGVEILHLSISAENPNHLIGLKITGDPNVPAGNASLIVHLDKPILLSLADQETIFDMITAAEAREEGDHANLVLPNQEGGELPDMRQPFAVPLDCLDRRGEPPRTCMARYVGKGRIAATYYTRPSLCRCHFIKFSETKFGVLWLDLHTFSIFHIVTGLDREFKS
ncbi:hypothetical protein PoB_003352100 [Plakobranchus ocellatus]|uniref:Uncharacterized protein n=1 Tax=Plakobranchus ocellatus TaxID=259542 RepID=A0AAV4A713_9GAST|nr:hypothetical protein PoB_003352100 [Plakobranchus ocellatus]